MGYNSHINPMGFEVLNPKTYKKVFGQKLTQQMPSIMEIDLIEKHLKPFNLPKPKPDTTLQREPTFLPTMGGSIPNHFQIMANALLDRARPGLEELLGDIDYRILPGREYDIELNRPTPPPELVTETTNAGWTRFEHVGSDWEITQVLEPLEQAFTYDTETFVQGSDFALPIIATATSIKAFYLWLSPQFVDFESNEFDYEQGLKELPQLGTGKFVVCWNSAYDSVRYKERYEQKGNTPNNFFFCAMSAHIVSSGFNSGQRKRYAGIKKKDRGYKPKWYYAGSPANLVEAYNFHCVPLGAEPVEMESKDTRKIFVKGKDLQEIRDKWDDIIPYSLKDAWITYQAFRAIYPKYCEAMPSDVNQAAHYLIAHSNINVSDEYYDWIDRCEDLFHKTSKQINDKLIELGERVYVEWLTDPEKIESDPWYKHFNWHIPRGSTEPVWIRDRSKLTAKSVAAAYLLRLTFQGRPVVKTKENGWGSYSAKGKYLKVPHPDGTNANVGLLLSSKLVPLYEQNVLEGDTNDALEVLDLLKRISLWTGYRKRMRGLPIVNGVYAIDAIPHQTTTGRGGSTTVLTLASHVESLKIGAATKTKLVAPKGYKLVGFDFEGQESQLGALFASCKSGLTGSSGIEQLCLLGGVHDKVQDELGVIRLCAKGLNYGIGYGCGVKKASNTVFLFHPEKSKEECFSFAKKHTELFKGGKDKTTGYWSGGWASQTFNKMNSLISVEEPVNPISGFRLPPAQTPYATGSIGSPAQLNWFIQSSGRHMLDLVMVSNWYWYDRLGLDARLALTCHDELRSIAKEEHVDKVVFVNHMSHLHSWALVHYRLGMIDFPVQRGFTEVAVDDVFRKSINTTSLSISNHIEVPPAYEVSIKDSLNQGVDNLLANQLIMS